MSSPIRLDHIRINRNRIQIPADEPNLVDLPNEESGAGFGDMWVIRIWMSMGLWSMILRTSLR